MEVYLPAGKNNERVCLTTFVYGERYQAYIPFLVYSCYKSNPDYDLILFVYGNLSDQVKNSLDNIAVKNYRIIEHAFDDCPRMTPLKAMSLRWVLWDHSFLNYDYLYIVDIDMIYLREDIPLHRQHLIHISTTGLSFDNMRRKYVLRPFGLTTFFQRIKYAGLVSFSHFLFGDKVIYRASGLHFIVVQEYYKLFTEPYRQQFLESIYKSRWLKYVMIPDNEALLYYMLEVTGLHPERMPVQSNPFSSIDFRNPERNEFRPHHGIHLGLFRSNIGESEALILECPTYRYYADLFKTSYLNDDIFRQLVEKAPAHIKRSLDLMYKYYGLISA